MSRPGASRRKRLRRLALMIAAVAGAIVAAPFILMLLVARLSNERGSKPGR
ncbi:hypothetical protein [Sphingomonas sp. NPDC079357]|uniref:hypothetical protein n=1 Tax=Sphingomonas sp. NPDC079357 TaxID=3364518 RepID=UPI00384CC280